MIDDERFTRHWTQAQPIVASYINSMIRDFHEAEDLLQNVAVVLLRKFPEYDRKRPFVSWALGIAKLEVLASRRSHARGFLSYRPEIAETVAMAYEGLVSELKIRTGVLQECMATVKGHSLQVLTLRYQEALKPREIAERLDLAAGNVRVILSRIRGLLQECVRRRLGSGVEAKHP